MIHFRCPKCNKGLGVNESQAGKVGVCPECKGKFRVPGVWTVDEFTALARKESQPSQKDDVPPPPMRKRRRDEEDDDLPSEDDEEERKPARKRKKKRRKKGLGLLKRLDFYWASLIVLGGISLLSLALSPIWPGGGVLAIVLGLVLAVCGGLWEEFIIWEDSFLTLLLCNLVPFYYFYYLLTHFEELKRPFLANTLGLILFILGLRASGIMTWEQMGERWLFGR